MQSFYQDWLKKNNEENQRALNRINPPNQQDPIPSTSRGVVSTIDPIPSTSNAFSLEEHAQGTFKALPNITLSASDIVYQKDGLQLLVERGLFQRQKKFSLQEKITLRK